MLAGNSAHSGFGSFEAPNVARAADMAGATIQGGTVERAVPHLPADDLRTAKEFYVTKLGFRVAFEASDDGRSGILGLTRGGIQITVDCPMEGHRRNACVSLEVEDADAYSRCRG